MVSNIEEIVSAEDAEAIGYTMVEAAERIKAIDKITPGACMTVALFVNGVEYYVFMHVKRGD